MLHKCKGQSPGIVHYFNNENSMFGFEFSGNLDDILQEKFYRYTGQLECIKRNVISKPVVARRRGSRLRCHPHVTYVFEIKDIFSRSVNDR